MSTLQPAEEGDAGKTPVLGYARTAPGMAVLLCRVLAIWMFAWGLYSSAGVVGVLISGTFNRFGLGFAEFMATLIAAILPAGIWLLFAWYCWRKAPKLASRMANGADLGGPSAGMSSAELLQVLLVGIGAYLLTEGLPMTGWLVYAIIENMRNGPVQQIEYRPTVFSALVRVALGVWLVLRPRGVAELMKRYGKWQDDRYEVGASKTE